MVIPEDNTNIDNSNDVASIEDNNTVDNRRGIRNVSKVSCHVACAIQILCHAIPPVRSTLRRLAAFEETRAAEDYDILDGEKLSPHVLLEELLDFVRVANPNGQEGNKDTHLRPKGFLRPPTTTPWNPERLYNYLYDRSNSSSSALAINPHDVGDSTRSLSCLLRLISQETACGGPAWKALLDASVWEGETLQILEGRRFLESDEGEKNVQATAPSPGGEDGETNSVARRFLLRVKPAVKTKPMSSPLVLKFSSENYKAITPTKGGMGTPLSLGSTNWSVTKALNEIVEPKTMQGSSYPWDSISPDTYSEQEIVCFPNPNGDDNAGKLGADIHARDSGSSSSSSSSDSDSDGDSDSDSDSDSDNDSDNDSDCDSVGDMEWLTSKRLEIKRIPRIWLLHLDRPRISVDQIRRLQSLSTLESNEQEDYGKHFSLIDHVHVPLDLKTASIMTTVVTPTGNVDTGSDFHAKNHRDDENDSKNKEQSSCTSLFLQGAIIQVLELDDDSIENEEDWEGGHSVTLLRNSNADESLSWMLVDDEKTQQISEERAVRLIGGVLESNPCAPDNDNGSDKSSGLTYFAASLLVYSVPEDVNDNDHWNPIQEDIVSSWKEHKTQLAATVASQKELVGKRIRVKWAKGKFYSGVVTRYDLSTGKHQVTYDDGDVKDYNLAKKTIEWID